MQPSKVPKRSSSSGSIRNGHSGRELAPQFAAPVGWAQPILGRRLVRRPAIAYCSRVAASSSPSSASRSFRCPSRCSDGSARLQPGCAMSSNARDEANQYQVAFVPVQPFSTSSNSARSSSGSPSHMRRKRSSTDPSPVVVASFILESLPFALTGSTKCDAWSDRAGAAARPYALPHRHLAMV